MLVNWSQRGKQGFGSFYYSKNDSFLLYRQTCTHNQWLLLLQTIHVIFVLCWSGQSLIPGALIVALLCYLQNQLREFVNMHLFIYFFIHFH